MSTKVYPGTQAIARAIALLQAFDDGQPERSLPSLCEETGLNRTTVYRMLSVLESSGLVAYSADRDRYRLGSELIVFGAKAQRANPLRELAHPVLQRLAAQTGEMASLEVLEGDKTLILDEIKGEKQRRLSTSIGNLWPAHATSTGKVLLAHQAETRRQEIITADLVRMTPQSITDPVALQTQLRQARQQGYALAINELEIGLTEVAAAIFDHRGEAIGAISVGGPTIRLPVSVVKELVPQLKTGARSISEQLGYRE